MENTSTALKLAILKLRRNDEFPRGKQRKPCTQRACNNVSTCHRLTDSADIARLPFSAAREMSDVVAIGAARLVLNKIRRVHTCRVEDTA